MNSIFNKYERIRDKITKYYEQYYHKTRMPLAIIDNNK